VSPHGLSVTIGCPNVLKSTLLSVSSTLPEQLSAWEAWLLNENCTSFLSPPVHESRLTHISLRNLGSVGHIEDIAVLSSEQGKKLGLWIIQTLDHIAHQVGCYKAILDCSEKNQPFYEKCGYTLAGIQMVGS
jgi:hypothetical protein